MNTEFKKYAENDFEKDSFKLMSNAVLEKQCKTIGNIEILNQ